MPYCVGSLKDYISVCGRCGCALKTDEVAATLSGVWQDFEDGLVYEESHIHFCPECKEAVMKYSNDPVRKAWLRMQALEHP